MAGGQLNNKKGTNMKSLKEISDVSYLSLEDIVVIEENILKTGYFTPERARQELKWFTIDLGIDEYYFRTTSIREISEHLIALSASKLFSEHGGAGLGIQLINEKENKATYIVEEESSKTEEIEKRIEQRYPMFRIESYQTKGSNRPPALRFYIVTRPLFKSPGSIKGEIPKTGKATGKKISFEEAANHAFLKRSEKETLARYREAWEAMNKRESPYIAVTDKPDTDETRVMVGIHGVVKRQFLANFSHLLYKYGINSNRKYREIFLDGKRIYSFYFDKMEKKIIGEFLRDLNAVIMLPDNPITELFRKEIYSAQETMYAISAAVFTHQFMSILTAEYMALEKALKDQPEAKGILDNFRLLIIKDTFSSSRIAQTVINHYKIVSLIYSHFLGRFMNEGSKKSEDKLRNEIISLIDRDVPSSKERTILKFFLEFNGSILKTNFLMQDKTCVSYRLEPSFLNSIDFPEKLFGLFFLVGREFIGFHIRFRDIARGGIRIVKSRNIDAYLHNVDTIFFENYNLASTQQKKNKDIPEGGSKGTILLNITNQEEEERAFKSYIDGILDVIMPDEEMKDYYGKKEILFMGPDERTAGLMGWAALYAKRRKYNFWKASILKVLVDKVLYGMTTIGIHEYVLGVLEKLNLREDQITKVQTGGPDGDLGSNEIKISKDKTLVIIDGSGVLFDPEGLRREELIRLADKRAMAEEFNTKLLSPKGFFVSVNDKEITLPDGTFVSNGEDFRNRFHLDERVSGDILVPCGGRPGAINISNWQKLFDRRGNPKFKAIIEGANLFITEDARLRLEENGIILFKDASTNKGGVTSSSLEVFASLALSDDEFEEHMRVHNGKLSDFRKAYIDEIIKTIKKNARSEFNLMWKEHEEKGTPFTVLTNEISKKINQITDSVYTSDLVDNSKIKELILRQYTPDALLKLVGFENIIKRVPSNYINSIVATKIATDFVYGYGLDAGEVDFYTFLEKLGK